VTSIVGRFLEHTRIFWFANGGHEEVYLGSADLMPRNLDRRVEILFPVRSPALVRRLHDEILGTYFADNVKARFMQPDGSYARAHPGLDEKPLDSQEWLLARRKKAKKRKKARMGTLVPGKTKKKSGKRN